MRYVSWLLSFLLHTTLFVVLVQTIHLAPLELRDVMEVDLTEMEMPEKVATLPVPQPVPEPPPDTPAPMGDVAPMPLPQDKTIVLDDSPPPPVQPVPQDPAPQPEPEPDVVEISPVKTPVEDPVDIPKRVVVRKNDTIVHRGHEARFGRAMMADYYSYSASEFSGQFTTLDDRTISIIDARNTKYGRFLIYDSKNKTLRRMKEFGKYVYTIGPSVYEDEPVTGTVTFLAKDDRIERFILMTDDDRMAHYPRKVHVREEETTFPTATGERPAYISMPPFGDDHPGVVFVQGNRCVEPGLVRGFTRALSGRNLASITFMPRGCSDSGEISGTATDMVADTLAALTYFSTLPRTDAGRVGIWGNGPGVAIAITATATAPVPPPYVVCLLDDSAAPEGLPNRTELASLSMPVLWMVTGHDTRKWQPLITTLEQLRDTDKKPFSIVVAPLKASRDVLDAQSEQSGWVESVSEDHARLAVSWIRSIGK